MNLRPGAFITHDVTVKAMPYKARGIAIIGQSGVAVSLKKLTNKTETDLHFANDTNARKMISFVQERIFCDIIAVGLESKSIESYKIAIDTVLANSDNYIIVTDIDDAILTTYVNEQIKLLGLDKLFVTGCEKQLDIATYAKNINSERVCITAPAIFDASYKFDYSPLFLAVLISASENVASNLAGEKISSHLFIGQALSEVELNNYLYNGVSVFETVGESIYLVRGMTTRTQDESGNYDSTYRNIGVVIAADSCKQSLFIALSQQISAGSPAVGVGSVLTIVVSELERLIDREIISTYKRPVISLDEADQTICKIAVNVGIKQGINQIYLHLNMQV